MTEDEYYDELNNKRRILRSQSHNSRYHNNLNEDYRNFDLIYKKRVTTADLLALAKLKSVPQINKFMDKLKKRWMKESIDKGDFNCQK